MGEDTPRRHAGRTRPRQTRTGAASRHGRPRTGLPFGIGPARAALERLLDGVRAVAFWSSLLVPLAYLPVLSGRVPDPGIGTVLGLLVLHVSALVAGRKYGARAG